MERLERSCAKYWGFCRPRAGPGPDPAYPGGPNQASRVVLEVGIDVVMARLPAPRRGLLIPVLLVVAAVLPVGPARAALSCAYDPETKIVTVVNTGALDFAVNVSHDGDISTSQSDCGSATRFNTDLIRIIDSAAANTIALGAGAPFQPGFTDEPGPSDEIEIEMDLGFKDTFQYVEHPTNVRAGSDPMDKATALNLNAGESEGVDADVLIDQHVRAVYLSANGDDGSRLDTSGGAATGGPYAGRTILIGSLEADVLIAGLRRSDISAYSGADKIIGSPVFDSVNGSGGADEIDGLDGNDGLRGGEGEDDINGGDGDDIVRGNTEDDTLVGGPGDDQVFGGGGSDACSSAEGGDEVFGCEKDA
jgi:Ca2+-binding RTX toxin-like protein